MKHFSMLKAPAKRKEKHLLITSEGKEFEPFNITMRNMARQGYSHNTITQYAGHIARFIDYLYEAAEHTPSVTAEAILDAAYSYRPYLLFGVNADDELVKKVAQEIRPDKVTDGNSLIPISAAINYFLTLSDVMALADKQETLFDSISVSKTQRLTQYEINGIKRSSMLAGVIRSGPRLTKKSNSIFGKISKENKEYTRVAMPFEKVGELISQSRTFRDKAFYSLLAASGCRQSEAIQIWESDIDFEKREVKLVSPFKRNNKYLSERESENLAWKGRATQETFLIEPFKQLFFENVRQYIRHERIANEDGDRDDFFFQKRDGTPFFTASRQSRAETFRKLKNKIDLHDRSDITAHSIRHMYGFYTLNYIPVNGGQGLSEGIVRVLMGHSSLESTRVYARHDKDRIAAAIEFSNQSWSEGVSNCTFDEMRIKYHQREIDRLNRLQLKADNI